MLSISLKASDWDHDNDMGLQFNKIKTAVFAKKLDPWFEENFNSFYPGPTTNALLELAPYIDRYYEAFGCRLVVTIEVGNKRIMLKGRIADMMRRIWSYHKNYIDEFPYFNK